MRVLRAANSVAPWKALLQTFWTLALSHPFLSSLLWLWLRKIISTPLQTLRVHAHTPHLTPGSLHNQSSVKNTLLGTKKIKTCQRAFRTRFSSPMLCCNLEQSIDVCFKGKNHAKITSEKKTRKMHKTITSRGVKPLGHSLALVWSR